MCKGIKYTLYLKNILSYIIEKYKNIKKFIKIKTPIYKSFTEDYN